MTNSPFAPLHGPTAPLFPQPCPFHCAKGDLVTSGILAKTQSRCASVCGSAADVALRLRSRRLSACAPLFPLAARRPKRRLIFHRAASRLKLSNIWQWPRSRNPSNNGSAVQSAKWRFDRGKYLLPPSARQDRPAKSAACFSAAPREFVGQQCFCAAIDASFSQW